jgi:hypothetical protein
MRCVGGMDGGVIRDGQWEGLRGFIDCFGVPLIAELLCRRLQGVC